MSKFQEYIPIYEGDRYCLMCSQACPVRRVTKNEATSPHGWALLVASVNRGMLQWNADSVNVLYQCADCGLCQGNCATDRPLPYALMAARAEVVALRHAPASVRALEETLRKWGNPYGEVPLESSSVKREPSNVALFVGDAAHFLQPSSIAAAEKLLNALGASSIRLNEGRSSGYLPYTLGLWDMAREMAQATVSALQESGATRIVAPSPQDAHTLQHVYGELGVALPDGVSVMTLVDVLADAGKELQIKPRAPRTYTYHDPTQAIRLKHHTANARKLAVRAMGGEPREMLLRHELAPSIGTSGGLQFTQPALAEKLVRARIAEAQATGAEILLTDDPLDTARLEQYAHGIQVLNLYQVLADQLETTKSKS